MGNVYMSDNYLKVTKCNKIYNLVIKNNNSNSNNNSKNNKDNNNESFKDVLSDAINKKK